MLFQTVKADLEAKRPTMDKLCSMSQDLLSSVKNKEVASKLEARLDSFAQRWDRLIQSLELSISQVPITPNQCLLIYNRDDSQSWQKAPLSRVFTDDWVCFYRVFLSESNLCCMHPHWYVICAAIRTLLWWNLGQGNCKSLTHNEMKELAGWKRSLNTSERFMCHSGRGYRGRKDGIKVYLCSPATTNKHSLIKTSTFSTGIQGNYVFVFTLLSVWLLFTSLCSYLLLWNYTSKTVKICLCK